MAARLLHYVLAAALAAGAGSAARAADTSPSDTDAAEASYPLPSDEREPDIFVTGQRGRIQIDALPEAQYDQARIRGLGESNLGGLLDSIAPRTRGSGGAGPVVLLNGRRISGFSEVSSLPPEAIERIDVLPEEEAIRQGYGPGARVVNILLLPRYAAQTAEAEQGFATAGGRSTSRIDLSMVRIRSTSRWTLAAHYQKEGDLLESERRIAPFGQAVPFDLAGNVTALPPGGEIDPTLSALAGTPVTVAAAPASAATAPPGLAAFLPGANRPSLTDTRPFRTLLPSRERFAADGSFSTFIFNDISATLTIHAERSEGESLLGLPAFSLRVPAGAGISPFASPVLLHRFAAEPGPLRRRTEEKSASAGLALNGGIGPWRWSLVANHNRARGDTATDAGPDAAALQAAVDGGLNPFGPLPVASSQLPRRSDRWTSRVSNAEITAYGALARLPAGPLSMSVTGAAQRVRFATRDSGFPDTRLGRDRGSAAFSLDLPIARRGSWSPAGLGDLSASLAAAVSSLSDFGTIRRLNTGLAWSPVRPLRFTAAMTDEQRAPAIEQLGNPSIITPNVRIFDYSTGNTVEVTRTDGGNPALAAGKRTTWRLGFLFRPLQKTDLSLQADYARSRERNAVSTFPYQTSELEIVFPDRFERDAGGRLIAVDSRPINLRRTARDELRWGVNTALPLRDKGADGRKVETGQVQLSFYHSWALRDQAVVRPGVAPLDFLAGSAADNGLGRPEHRLELQAGYYRKGLGLRLHANYQGPSQLRDRNPVGPPSADIRFSSLATADLRAFADLDQRTGLLRRAPWLKGTRLSLGVANLLDSRPRARDGNGVTPSAFQPAYLDPVGRSVTFTIRKLFG